MAAAQDVDTTEIECTIKGLLISRPTVASANLLLRELEDDLGKKFPLRQLGFRTFVDYLKSIPHVVQLESHNSSNPNVFPVASKLSKHVDQLVSKQRVSTSKKRGVSRRGSYNSRPAPIRRRPASAVPRPGPVHSGPPRPGPTRPGLTRSGPPVVRPNQVDQPNTVQPVDPNFLTNILWDLAKLLAVSWKSGIDVREYEGYLARNYDQRDLSRNGIHNAGDVLSHVERFIERGDTKIYPKLVGGPNNTNHSSGVNCIPAGLEDDFDDDDDDWSYDDDEFVEEEAAKDSEEELSNHVINMLSKKASGSDVNVSSSRLSEPKDESSHVDTGQENLHQNEDTANECNISDAMIKNFRLILSQHQDGIWASQLQQFYFEQFGVSFDPQDLGHTSVISMASTLPGVFSYCREGPHDWKLYDARYITQESLDALGNGGDIALPENERYIPQTIIENIKKLLEDNPGGFRSIDLLQIYAATFKKPLNLDILGFPTLEEFLMILKNDVKLMKVLHYYLLLPKHKLVSEEALLPTRPDERLNVPPEVLGVPVPDGVLRLGEEIPLQELPPVLMDPDPDKPLLELEVRVAEVITPAFFYITLGSMYEELEKMMDDLEKFYTWEEANFKIPLPHVAMNLYCAARYQEFWHRAKITRIRSSGDVEIEYIDYGTPATVKSSELRYLSKEFSYLPAQALCAKCMGVKPLRGETKFSPYVCQEFLNIVEGKRLMAYVYQVTERVRLRQERMQLEVILFDVEDPDREIVINDYLIEKGLASSILEVEEPAPEVEPVEIPLLQNDLIPLQANGPAESPPSESLQPPENISSSHPDNTSTSHPASSKMQEEKKPRRPPPGFERLPDDPVIDLSSQASSTTQMPSSTSKPTNTLSEEQKNYMINNYFLVNGPVPQLVLQEQYRQNFGPNPSNMPLSGPPLFQTQPNGNQRSLTYGSIVPPSNPYHIPQTNMYGQQNYRTGASIPQSYLHPVSVPVIPAAPGFYLVNAPVPNPYLQLYPPPMPNMTGQGDVIFAAQPVRNSPRPSPVLAKTTPIPSPTTSRPGSTPSPSRSYTPITVPEWPPANLPKVFTSNPPTKTKSVTCTYHSIPASPKKPGPPEADHIPRPCTPLTPASAEVADLCPENRPNSDSSQHSSPPVNTPASCQSQDNANLLSTTPSNSQIVESAKETVFSSLGDEGIDNDFKTKSNMSWDMKGYPKPQPEMKDVFLAPDIVKEILYPPPSPEKLYSAISSPVDSLMRSSPLKEESSDDYASASENVEEAKHQLANLTLTEQDPSPAIKTPSSNEDIPDSWENLDLDDTPAKAANFAVDFSQPLDLIFKNLENKTNFEANNPFEKSIMDVTNRETPLNIQAPVNWKDVFNPDIISISESNNNNTTKENSKNSSKLIIKKVPVQEIELQGKGFHLLNLKNKTPAVIALEFFQQFVPTNVVQVSEKIIEAMYNKMYHITRAEHPAILAELEKVTEFKGGLAKKTVIRLNKVKVLNLSDIPECLKILNAFNKPLLDDLQEIAKELAKL